MGAQENRGHRKTGEEWAGVGILKGGNWEE